MNTYQIKNNLDVDSVLGKALNESKPILCEILAHPNEPFEPRVIPKGINNNGEIIAGELDDMYVSTEQI